MSGKNKENPRILIVDDTPKNIQVLGTILKQEGYRINVAHNGLHALKVVEKVYPDLILLDIMMSGLDGFETCKKLKDSEKTKDIPIIFLTAKTEIEDIIKGFELGAVDYVTKPFNSTELLARVRTHLDLKKSKDTIAEISNERKEMLHVLCHDLSNPFNFIISVLDMIENSDASFDEMKDKILTAVKNGLQIIDLVRNMRVLEEKKLELRHTNLSEAIYESYFILHRKFSEKCIDLEVNVDEDLNVLVEHVSFINSILNNIFTNAIKFSYRDSKIYVNADKTEKGVKLSIRDFGIGIPPKLLNDIFDVSKATSRQGTEGEIGTGFGMPLVRKFVTAYDGKINIISKEKSEDSEDYGTEVEIYLKS